MSSTVIGIDVGGKKKGFHVVVMQEDKFKGQTDSRDHLEKWYES